ncbi:hypothetical protein V8F20_004880 [Naviculisporaceae sp. PSN 640]
MAARPNNRPNPPPASSASARQNEYFVPRDGIDREVITSDICRYLGNDALVRPGTYESPDGRVIQGYFITAYRNLTSAMIQDLKADSARWEQERRAASRTGGGSREQARGQDYNTWKNRQERGVQDYETTYPSSGGMAMDIDYPPKPVNSPGAYNAPQYQVPASGYPAGAYPPQPPLGGAPAQYGGQGYAYPPQPPAQYPPGPQGGSGGYPGMPGPQAIPAGFNQDPYTHGSNYQTSPSYVTAGGAPRPLVSSAAASRSLYAPTAAAPVYPDQNDPYAYAGAATSANDPFLGRGAYNVATNPTPASSDDLGSPAGAQQPRTGYGGVPESQYDEVSALPPSSSTSTTPAQLATSGPPNPRHSRESEPRDTRGDHRDHRPRRSEPDRDDRHSSARHRHR